jgi:hypothetical protein
MKKSKKNTPILFLLLSACPVKAMAAQETNEFTSPIHTTHESQQQQTHTQCTDVRIRNLREAVSCFHIALSGQEAKKHFTKGMIHLENTYLDVYSDMINLFCAAIDNVTEPGYKEEPFVLKPPRLDYALKKTLKELQHLAERPRKRWDQIDEPETPPSPPTPEIIEQPLWRNVITDWFPHYRENIDNDPSFSPTYITKKDEGKILELIRTCYPTTDSQKLFIKQSIKRFSKNSKNPLEHLALIDFIGFNEERNIISVLGNKHKNNPIHDKGIKADLIDICLQHAQEDASYKRYMSAFVYERVTSLFCKSPLRKGYIHPSDQYTKFNATLNEILARGLSEDAPWPTHTKNLIEFYQK